MLEESSAELSRYSEDLKSQASEKNLDSATMSSNQNKIEEGDDQQRMEQVIPKEKDKIIKKQPDVTSNQFIIREGFTVEHRVAIMNREVKHLMSLGKHETALPICCEAVQLNQSPLSYLNRAHVYKNLKKYEEAIEDFTTVIENETQYTAAAYCQRGICYSKLSNYESAIENLNKSYQMEPSFSCAFNRGFIHAEAGNYDEAVADFNRVVDGKKEGELRNRAIYHRAVCYVNLKQYEDAKFDLRSILLKDPNALPPRSLLSKAYKFTGDFDQAEECLNQCITKDCEQAELYIERSYIRCRLGDNQKLREAYKDLNKAMTIYVGEYDNEKAAEEKRKADALEGDNNSSGPSSSQDANLPKLTKSNLLQLQLAPISRHNSGVDWPQSGKSSARTSKKSSSESSRPGSSGSRKKNRSRSVLNPKTKAPPFVPRRTTVAPKSCTVLKEVTTKKPPTVEYFGSTKIASVYAKLAQLLFLVPSDFFAEISNFDAALEYAEKAMSICPDNIDFTMVYITSLIRLSKYDKAFLLLDNVLKMMPKHKKALYYKAFCYRAIDDPYNAVDCLTKILSFENDDDHSEDADDDLLDGEKFSLRVLEMRGLLLHEQKAYKLALADFGRAICIDSKRPGNFYFRGNCHSKLGNFEMAIEDFRLAEKYGFANLPFLLMCKGVILRLIGDNEAAVEEFERGIGCIGDSSKKKDRNTKLLLCRLYLYKSLSFIAMKMYDSSLQNLSKIPEAVAEGALKHKSHAARLNAKIGLKAQLDGSYEDVIDPGLRWLVSYHSALCYYKLQEYSNGMTCLKDCLGALRDHVPDNVALGSCIFFYCISAGIVYKSPNPDEELFMKKCVNLLGQCLETDWCKRQDVNMMLCHFSLGKCHQRLEQHNEAIYHFTEAGKISGGKNEITAYVYFRRAWSYKAVLNYEEAANDFESAKMLKIDDPNFSINYRKINDIAYIEIDNEPDTTQDFTPIFPSFDM